MGRAVSSSLTCKYLFYAMVNKHLHHLFNKQNHEKYTVDLIIHMKNDCLLLNQLEKLGSFGPYHRPQLEFSLIEPTRSVSPQNLNQLLAFLSRLRDRFFLSSLFVKDRYSICQVLFNN